jgi:hypothetical protein
MRGAQNGSGREYQLRGLMGQFLFGLTEVVVRHYGGVGPLPTGVGGCIPLVVHSRELLVQACLGRGHD